MDEAVTVETVRWTVLKFGPDVHGPLTMNPDDFDDHMTFNVVPQQQQVTPNGRYANISILFSLILANLNDYMQRNVPTC